MLRVAGLGIISSIGLNSRECLQSLLAAETGIAPISILNTRFKGELPAGEVRLTNAELAQLAGLPNDSSRTILLSLIAAKEALADAALPDDQAIRMGFVSANTVGGMDRSEDCVEPLLSSPSRGHWKMLLQHPAGAATQRVAEALQLTDYFTTISTACSSSANAIMHGARLINAGKLDAAVAGGTDALCKFTLNGFKSLMILDGEPCQPFDENRRGLNLGEGAAYIVMVSDKVAQRLKKKPRALLCGYANANDAYHQTASSPEGTGNYFAMSAALKMAAIKPEQIGYINLHGTGTPNNDVSEGLAIQKIFGENIPALSSTKAYTGHTLGACGAVEAVFSVFALENGKVFPNLRFKTQMKELFFTPALEVIDKPQLEYVMSNSFGFGGNCSSLIFSKAE